MASLPKTKVDLGNITGKYPLLALFLLVTEGLLGLWIFLAENTAERIAAGILMTLIFGVFLLVVIQISREPKVGDKILAPEGLGKVTPAQEEVSKTQTESPEPQELASPDRAYIINKPPNDWLIQEITVLDYYAENLGNKRRIVQRRTSQEAGRNFSSRQSTAYLADEK